MKKSVVKIAGSNYALVGVIDSMNMAGVLPAVKVV